jgi:hypothetical protein
LLIERLVRDGDVEMASKVARQMQRQADIGKDSAAQREANKVFDFVLNLNSQHKIEYSQA